MNIVQEENKTLRHQLHIGHCDSCGKPIYPMSFYIRGAGEKHYHPDCLKDKEI
jgi:hypothetical protein